MTPYEEFGNGLRLPDRRTGGRTCHWERCFGRSVCAARHFQSAALGSVALCTALWMRAAGLDQDERGNAERRAIFVGLWVPTLWQISESLRDHE